MLIKTFCLLVAYASVATVTIHTLNAQKEVTNVAAHNTKKASINELSHTKLVLKKRAAQLKYYIATNGYNDSICFIINFAIPSGKPRFFIYNLKNDSILQLGLVTHGSGSETKNGQFVFKNIPNSLASANGKYKIGNSYYGQFGLAYKLYGLDPTNNKAYQRFIVLHSHECVPDKPVYPSPICVSWGCPTVAPAFLQQLAAIINISKQPILLDIGYIK